MIYEAFAISLVAVVYAVILVQPNMLLWPLYERLQNWTLRRYNGAFPEDIYWLKPLISCVLCVAGQWCFWGYLLLYFHDYHLGEHLYFTSLGIFTAALLRKIYLWTTQ